MNDDKMFLVASSPQIHQPDSTARIMLDVIIALIPAGIWGVYVFGVRALVVVAVSIIAAVVCEYLLGRVSGKSTTIGDYSALLTGLLIGYNMPADVKLYVPVIASFFAIAVVKWSFGGLGGNMMIPALAGRVFVFFSWTGTMTKWKAPVTNMGIDSISGASPLGYLKTGLMDFSGKVTGPMEFLRDYPKSSIDSDLTGWFSSAFGANIDSGYFDLFLGNISGCIGEVSVLLLLIGAIYLLIRKVITWEIPAAYLISFSVLIWIFGGTRFGNGLFTGDVMFNLFSGGLMLGAFYMATDMVTSPLTGKGQIVFGIGCGFLTFLIRVYGSFPEGVSLAIILMNIFVAMIDRTTAPKMFGALKKESK